MGVHRVRGHLIADLDPLRWKAPSMPPELDPATYGLTIWDLDREFHTGGAGGVQKMTLGRLLDMLRDAYCRSIGVEYMHIMDFEEQRWVQSKLEGVRFELSKAQKHRVLERLNAAEAFEKFLATKYVGTKRFGLEGAESAIPVLDQVLSLAADAGLDSAVLGMAHRGRLNVLANVMGKNYDQIFKEFEGYVDPSTVQGSGDVKYHLGALGKYEGPNGQTIKLELAANPSHLETVDPVVLGIVRAIQDRIEPAGSPALYECRVGDNHHHVVCRSCGVIADVDCAVGHRPCLEASDDHGFVIDETEVTYWGLCPSCASRPTTYTDSSN